MNVLIVSGDTDYRDIYTLGLRNAGFSARSVGTVDEIPGVLRNFRVHAVIFHFAADTEAGWRQFTGVIDGARQVPVILVTSWIHPGTPHAVLALDTGAAAIVIEPCPPGDLADIVERVVRGDRRVEWPMSTGDS